ncbi:MAG: xanthine dehydrogenase small subunit [Pseudomonadota bacterium]
MNTSINFSLNGNQEAADCRADMTVLEWLRIEKRLRGSKEGCAEGDCGACSVLVRRADSENYHPANSCIMLIGQLDGGALITVEGLAGLGEQGHAVQIEMAKNGSSQCGFCTPGIVCALSGLLNENSNPSDSDIHDALAGNLCRCTGYRPIVEAAQAAARTVGESSLDTKRDGQMQSVAGNGDSCVYHPATLEELHTLRKSNPDAVLLAGGTDSALAVAHAKARWPQFTSTRNIGALRNVEIRGDILCVGGAVTWQEFLPFAQQYWPGFATLIRRFGSVHIRSMGTLAGNLATASPIGDGAPALLALGAKVVLSGPDGNREVDLNAFFTGYRQADIRDDEIISSICVPLPKPDEIFSVYKVSKRYDQDISTVCGAFWGVLEDGQMSDCRIAFGGMAATPIRVPSAEAAMIGKKWDNESCESARQAIEAQLSPMTDFRGSADYRSRVAANLMVRFLKETAGSEEPMQVMAL